ncbi:MAG TPA: UdgX family uracil-DNA binding protein [Gammaproteobacteria bacterium]|nr:UdgX family uracil-DNA binding protein [Gammaproteobacteria bacterium]
MTDTDVTAADFLPAQRSMSALQRAAASCRGCDLYEAATQTVFGEGLKRSRLMLVGEMPGDKEDLAGKPFVGPAGRLLDEALEEAGIDRSDAYITNVVKHFKWEPRGKRRLHKTPNRREVGACLPWLEAEIALVKPAVFVCLGATAAKALLGPGFRVTEQHGRFVNSDWAEHTMATAHPSAVLRMRDRESRERARRELTADLATAARVLDGG